MNDRYERDSLERHKPASIRGGLSLDEDSIFPRIERLARPDARSARVCDVPAASPTLPLAEAFPCPPRQMHITRTSLQSQGPRCDWPLQTRASRAGHRPAGRPQGASAGHSGASGPSRRPAPPSPKASSRLARALSLASEASRNTPCPCPRPPDKESTFGIPSGRFLTLGLGGERSARQRNIWDSR